MEFELKYVVPNHAVDQALRLIGLRCQPDTDYPAAIVSSIYFDDRNLTSLLEKVNSDFYKTKVRIRWYGHSDTNVLLPDVFLETKCKQGTQRSKLRDKLAIAADALQDCELHDSPLFERIADGAGVNSQFYTRLLPILEVRYMRHRFVDRTTGSRISVDRDITMPRINRRLSPRATPGALQSAVIEVKGTRSALPALLHPLTRMGVRKSSFSKYLAGYSRCNNISFDPR